MQFPRIARQWIVISVFVCAALTGATANADSATDKLIAETQANDVGIVTGSPLGVYFPMASNIFSLLDDHNEKIVENKRDWLRLTVSIGAGSSANIFDLENLPNVSLAIVQGDVIDYYKNTPGKYRLLKYQMRYVSRLHTEVLHIIARKDKIKLDKHDVCDLRGARVNDGGPETGTHITVDKVLNDLLKLSVKFDEDKYDNNDAIERLNKGYVDAIAYVVGRKTKAYTDNATLRKLFSDNVVAWIDLPLSLLQVGCYPDGQIRDPNEFVYESVDLKSDDYPFLIQSNEHVTTLGVPAILVGFNFETNNGRSRQLPIDRFIRRILSEGPDPEKGWGPRNSM